MLISTERLLTDARVRPAWEHHAEKLVRWLMCMSYNDSYFGEPKGLVKMVTSELSRLINAPDEVSEVKPPKPETLELLSDRLDKIADSLPYGRLQSDLYAASYIYKKYLKSQSLVNEKIEKIRALKVEGPTNHIDSWANDIVDLVLAIMEDREQ